MCLLDSTHKWDHTVFFSDLFHSASCLSSPSTCACMCVTLVYSWLMMLCYSQVCSKVIQPQIHIHLFFFKVFPHVGWEYWENFHVLHSSTGKPLLVSTLVIHFKYSSMYLPIANFQFIPPHHFFPLLTVSMGFPGGLVVKLCQPTQAPQEIWIWSLDKEDPLSGGGNGNPLDYSCWDNCMDRRAGWAIQECSNSLYKMV